jgi:DNA-binding NarL/FixJ family response regulator
MPNVALLLCSSLVSDGLSALLTDGGFSVFPEADLPDDDAVVIIDLSDGLDLEAIRAYEGRGAKVVVLAHATDSLTLSDEEIALLSGLLTYSLSGDAFVRSLRLICSGERVFPLTLTLGRNRPAQPGDKALGAGDARLSPREREVLSHLVDGLSNKGIARILGMTEATVKGSPQERAAQDPGGQPDAGRDLGNEQRVTDAFCRWTHLALDHPSPHRSRRLATRSPGSCQSRSRGH